MEHPKTNFRRKICGIGISPIMKLIIAPITCWTIASTALPARALPPATDLPEEFLRNQIILEARSPLDGEVITAGEYADYVAKLERETADREDRAAVDKYRETAFILRLRRLLLYFGINLK
jgi:hypothetical protein